MALATLQCKNCGAHLEIDSNTASYICPNCHTTYAMEQTFNQTVQNTVIQNAQTVNVIDDGSGKLNQKINNAETRIRWGEYEHAQSLFKELTDKYAQDYRTWLGLARAISHNFTHEPTGKREFEAVCNAIRRAKITSAGNEAAQAEIEEASAAYLTQWETHSKNLVAQRNQKAEENKIREEEMCAHKRQEIDNIEATIAKKKAKLEKLEKLGKKVPLIAYAVVASLLLILTTIGNVGELTIIEIVGGLFSNLFSSALLCGICIWLPLRLIFFFIAKALRVPTEMMINSSSVKITQIKSEIRQIQDQLKNELYAVLKNTDWLDH